MKTAENIVNDSEHGTFKVFESAGFKPGDLVDPGHVNADEIRKGGWKVANWSPAQGVLIWSVKEEDIVESRDRTPSEYSINYTDDIRQPIGFAGESGPLNDRLNNDTMTDLKFTSTDILWFIPPDVEREWPTYNKEEALEALQTYGSEGYISEKASNAISEPFDVKIPSDMFREIDGESICRPGDVAKIIVEEGTEEYGRSAATISGKKRIRRQVYIKNMEVLKNVVGII